MSRRRPGPKPWFNDKEKATILRLSRQGVLQMHIAERFGISPGKVSEIVMEMKKREKRDDQDSSGNAPRVR
jgi:DNA-binding CsgD family transcriptional regulator